MLDGNQINRSSSTSGISPQPLTEPYVKLSLHTALLTLFLILTPPLLLTLANFIFGLANPFAPFPLQKLLRYYGLVRHSQTHRYALDILESRFSREASLRIA